jgi:hypothetical protein
VSVVTMVAIIADTVAIIVTIGGGLYWCGMIKAEVNALKEKDKENTTKHKEIEDVAYGTQRDLGEFRGEMKAVKETVLNMDGKLSQIYAMLVANPKIL